MKNLTLALSAAALAFCGSAASAETIQEKGEARLAKMLEGHVAGEPVSCIALPRSRDLHVIDRVGVYYDDGDTIYVARPENAGALDWDDVLVIDRNGSQLCKQDVRRTIDRSTGSVSGVVFLGDFVPYTKKG